MFWRIVKYLLWLSAGTILLWFALRDLPFAELQTKLSLANYGLLFPVFAITLFGYWARIKRWQLLLSHLQHSIPWRSGFIAVSAGYLVSYVIPRGGEVTRCLLVQRKHQVGFSTALATIIVERFTDTFCLFLFITAIITWNVEGASQFFSDKIFNPVSAAFGEKIGLLFIVLGIGSLVCFIVYRFFNRFWKTLIQPFLLQLKTLVHLPNKGLFALYTLFIWLCYFLMTFIWIYAFDESSGLTLSEVFVIMIVGTIGKSIPIQGGGMGAYHYLVAQVFLVYGVGLITGNALAIIIHGAQTIFTILTGSLAYLLLFYDEKKRPL